jgi:hypothetical protein
MAITLAPDELSDAEITDGIALGDVGSAARLWVRLWPTAQSAARELVEPAVVPGLAAEALIGTIAAIAVGRGPREDVTAFVRGAVRELGEDDGPPPAAHSGASYPDVFASPMMSRAFAGLPDRAQEILRIAVVGDHAAEVRAEALTALQRAYLAEHTDRAEGVACRLAHGATAGAVEEANQGGLSGETWVHLSSCAWCTEAFHELAFSNTALSALVDRAVWAPAVETLAVVEPETVEPPRVELPAAPAPPGIHAAAAPPGFLRRHGRIMAGAAVAVAATAVIAVIMAGQGGAGRSAAGAEQSQDASEPPDSTPTASQTLAVPSVLVPSPSVTPASDTSDAPSRKPSPRTPRPSGSTSSSPSTAPEPTPTASPPSPTPAPTPTAAPCNPVLHLLGLC